MWIENLDFDNNNSLDQKDIKLLWEFLAKTQDVWKLWEFIWNLESSPQLWEILRKLKESFINIIKSSEFKLETWKTENIMLFQFYSKFFLGKNTQLDWILTKELEQTFLDFKKSNEITWEIWIEILSFDEIKKADLSAQKELWEFTKSKAERITSNQMLLWPTLDLSMAYVIGSMKNSQKFGIWKNLAYWWEKEWEWYKKYLAEKWAPFMSPKEMAKISKIWYFGRLEWKPDWKWVAKHFPGWDEKLTLTHTWPIKFWPGNQYVTESLNLFAEIIKSNKAPKWIMMAHASYDISYFPWIEAIIERDKNKFPYLKDIPFDEIPASLNPYLNSYLREKLWFTGNIIPDWFGWMSAYMEFVNKVKLDFDFNNDAIVKLSYLSIMAWNNFITWIKPNAAAKVLNSTNIWENMWEKNPDLYELFTERLMKGVKPFLKDGNEEWSLRIVDLIYLMMAEPELNVSITKEDNWIVNLNFNWSSDKIRDYIKIHIEGFNAESIKDNVIESWLSQNDVWTRSWVQALIYRQAFVQELYFKINWEKLQLPQYPNKIDEEDKWFEDLMSNKEFRKYYDNINWDKLAEV